MAPEENGGPKPSVLIIGGLGYIGRFLAKHIHDQGLASELRLVDKVLPQLAWLPQEFEAACSGENFVQADASREREFAESPLNFGSCCSVKCGEIKADQEGKRGG